MKINPTIGRPSGPLITSLFQTDVYKSYMLQYYYFFRRLVEAEFAFKLRDLKVKQAEIIPMHALKEQLEYVRDLTFTAEELDYKASMCGRSGKPYFDKEYLYSLKDYHLSPFFIKEVKGNYDIRSKGKVMDASLWETFTLSIDNELYYDYLPDLDWVALYKEARRRLMAKIAEWKKYPGMKIIDFSTRRRRSGWWQEEVVLTLAKELGEQFLGTSNLYLAMKHGLKPIGTMAHEIFMIEAAISGPTDEGLKESYWTVLRNWKKRYPHHLGLNTVLPDTFGTDFFFKEIPQDLAEHFTGYRHDSEDPIIYTDKFLAFLDDRKFDPASKEIPFSDGLTGESSINVYKQVNDKIPSLYALGTSLGNDFGLPALPIVMKPVRANGWPTVKLSDNPAKATGEDEDEINRYRRVFANKVEDHAWVECKS